MFERRESMFLTKRLAEKSAVLLIVLGILVSLTAGSFMAFAQEAQPAEAQAADQPAESVASLDLEAVTAAVAAPTLKLLTDTTTLEAVVQKSLQDTIGVASEAFVGTGVVQDLADQKEAARKAAEEAARKAAEEAARKKAEAAAKKEAKILATAQKYVDESGVDVSAADLLLMARVIYFEANVEPYAGKVAVANVILNRLNGGYADTIKGVVYYKGAFSVVKRSDFATKAPNESCYKAAIEALQGRNEVANCMWFVSTSVKSCWATKNAKLYTTIGSHRFFYR